MQKLNIYMRFTNHYKGGNMGDLFTIVVGVLAALANVEIWHLIFN